MNDDRGKPNGIHRRELLKRSFERWSNLRRVRDIAEPIGDLARFGSPAPL